MGYRKSAHIMILSLLIISLVTTSFGVFFPSPALAATAEVRVQDEKSVNSVNKEGVISGIVAIGLISLLAGHSGGQTDGILAVQTSGGASPSVKSFGEGGEGVNTSAGNIGYSADEKRAFDLLNGDRAKQGLQPLKFNLQLAALGGKYAQEMINRKFFAHKDPEGNSPFDRMKEAGIGYVYAGENLAINTNINTAEQAFMNSPGHRSNILSPNYTEVGLGVRYDGKGATYVVQEFIGK